MGLFSRIFNVGKSTATYAAEKAEDAIEAVTEKTGAVVNSAAETAGGAIEKVVEKVSDAADSVETRVKSRRSRKAQDKK